MTKYVTYSVTNYYTKAIEVPDNATNDFIMFKANEYIGVQGREARDFSGDDYDYSFLAISDDPVEGRKISYLAT